MNGTVGTTRRIGTVVARLAAVIALALLLAGTVAPAVHAADNNTSGPAMDKSKFKEGCEEGHGSYVENNDGSFQCNLAGGGVLYCPSTTSQCTFTPLTGGKTGVYHCALLNSASVMTMLGAQSQPTPTPTRTVVLAGAVKTGGLTAKAP